MQVGQLDRWRTAKAECCGGRRYYASNSTRTQSFDFDFISVQENRSAHFGFKINHEPQRLGTALLPIPNHIDAHLAFVSEGAIGDHFAGFSHQCERLFVFIERLGRMSARFKPNHKVDPYRRKGFREFEITELSKVERLGAVPFCQLSELLFVL